MGAGLLSGSQKSIIDRCTASVYQNYFHAKGALPMPLLSDWRAEVLKQPDPEAREIALAAELITEGSLNVFAHPTNVDKDADGNLLIVHCSGGANGVVITGAAGFTSVARPECFS